MLIRLSRRHLGIVLAIVGLCAPVLAGCGFNLSTERPYTPAVGANDVDGTVDVLNAVVVSSTPGSGTFIASLSNNDYSEPATFASLAAGTASELTVDEFEPVQIPRGGLVNLAEAGGVTVTGDFEAGGFVSLTVTFGSGERASLQVPVVANAGDFSGLDDEPSASPTDAESETTG
ncbi:MAG: hypothetical protein ACR2JD_02530 [Nocardioides sp.]